MGLDSLLGNARLKENLRASLARGRTSHFYLISGPSGSGKKTLARLLAAALVCKEADRPCLNCSACRKIMANTHPDLITVTDKEHKNVAVKIVREIRDDMFVKPNQTSKKIYLFPQELGIEGQNALLKVLEEPPEYAVAILIADNPEKILTTVRSRCTELNLQALSAEELASALCKAFPEAEESLVQGAIARSGGYLGQAKALLEAGGGTSAQTEQFISAFTQKNTYQMLTLLTPMGAWSRDKFLEEICLWTALLQQALSCRSGMPAASQQVRLLAEARSAKELLQAIRNLQKAIEYTHGNVSVAAVCGWLTWL